MNELVLFDRIRDIAVFIWGVWFVKILVFHVFLNLGVGIAAAIYTNEFSFGKVGEFLYRKLLPFVLVLVFAEAFAPAVGINWLGKSAWVLIEMTLVGDLMGSLKKLGVPIPDALFDRFES